MVISDFDTVLFAHDVFLKVEDQDRLILEKDICLLVNFIVEWCYINCVNMNKEKHQVHGSIQQFRFYSTVQAIFKQ